MRQCTPPLAPYPKYPLVTANDQNRVGAGVLSRDRCGPGLSISGRERSAERRNRCDKFLRSRYFPRPITLFIQAVSLLPQAPFCWLVMVLTNRAPVSPDSFGLRNKRVCKRLGSGVASSKERRSSKDRCCSVIKGRPVTGGFLLPSSAATSCVALGSVGPNLNAILSIWRFGLRGATLSACLTKETPTCPSNRCCSLVLRRR
jgi:hypothetical protein